MALSAPLDTYRWFQGDREQRTIFWICGALIGQFAVAAGALLCGVDAPYGRYNQASEKKDKGVIMRAFSACDLPPKLAWVLQECPTLIAATGCWLTGRAECIGSLGNRLTMFTFVAHYINRTIVYPLRIMGSKPIPLPVMMMAMGFCSVNGYIQCTTLTRHTIVRASSWTTPLGVGLWGLGVYINTESDRILRELRKPGETGYKIPRGGLFDYVSGANFFGEIVEWIGYAVAMGGALPGVTFAICTAFNIGPRAIAHHRWYLDKFKGEYPKERKALIPFVW
jgi:3-oxo-5-alpha-steroid 4-dehydrogenase 1